MSLSNKGRDPGIQPGDVDIPDVWPEALFNASGLNLISDDNL